VKSPKNTIILLLAATTVGGSILAWRQYGELVELRAATLNRDERADLQKRIWELEKSNRDLQAQLGAGRGLRGVAEGTTGATGEETAAEGPRERGGPGRGGRGDPRGGIQQMNAIRDLMNKPEVQALVGLQQKAAIDARYAALFNSLNLAPEQADKLKMLLAERSTTMQDVMAAAREQGINPRDNPDGFRKLIADAQNQINGSIKETIGDGGFAQLTNYEQTLPQRNLVTELQQRLSYTNTPLTAAQGEQLVNILAATTPARPAAGTPGGPPPEDFRLPGGPGRGPGDGGGRGPDIGGMIAGVLGGGPGMMGGEPGRGPGTAVVTPAAVSQAQTVLAPPQVAALQQIQQQQQAQQQLRQLINETLTANQPPANPARGAPPPRPPGGK
jgi:hypothetical protein